MVANLNDGTSYSFLIGDDPQVTFDSAQEKVRITSDLAEASFDFSSFLNFTFADAQRPTAQPSLETGGKEIVFKYVGGDRVDISGLSQGMVAKVYSQGGVMVRSAKASETVLNLDLSGFSEGIYLVNVNNQTIKIFKR